MLLLAIFSAGSKAIRCAAVNAAQWRALSKLTNKADDRFRARRRGIQRRTGLDRMFPKPLMLLLA